MSKKNCIFGTAGHIDHGKSSLLKKLTGTNPDRLKEEKKRGITIDLGFTFLENNNFHIGFIDVPGHERLVKNMIAGATGFDACLFAVDVKETIMPQTIEHTNIVKSLGVENIIVAITKSDLADNYELALGIKKIKEFYSQFNFKNITFVTVSIFNDESIKRLKKIVFETAEKISPKNSNLPFLLRVDRSFSVKGFGTVVTGTAISGKVFTGQELQILPKLIKTKVKGINVNNNQIKYAVAGQRVALNINTDKKDVKRGNLIAEDNSLTYTNKFFTHIKLFNIDNNISIKHNKNYPIFIGTAHYNCKIILLEKKEIKNNESGFAIIKLNEPYAPFYGENFLIRGLSPQITIAGGKILSISDFSLNRDNLLKALSYLKNKNYDSFINTVLDNNTFGIEIPPKLQFIEFSVLNEFFNKNDIYVAGNFIIKNSIINKILENVIAQLTKNGKFDLNKFKENHKFNENLYRLLEKRITEQALKSGFIKQGNLIKKNEKTKFEILAEDILNEMFKDISLSNSTLVKEKFNLDDKVASNVIKYLNNKGYITQLTEKVWINKKLLEILLKKIEDKARKNTYVDLKSVKEIINAPRKILVPLIEYLDKTGKYVNKDNKRFLKK